MSISSERIASIEAKKHDLSEALAAPGLTPDEFVRLSKDYAAIEPVAAAAREVRRLRAELKVLTGLADDSTAEAELREMAVTEAEDIRRRLPEAERALAVKLLPRDSADERAAMLEVRAGTGGDEAALFAGDLLRMYLRYAERRGWKTEVLSATESDLGGYKDVQMAVKGSSNDPAEGVYARLKFEGGVHRVQRVPVTESQGRIHTSAAGVLVLPEVDEPEELDISQNDLKIDVYRSSGPGGQSVNTTDSAVRITHLPTGIVVAMQNEKSQLQNREAGMRVLRARILAHQQEQIDAENSAQRKSQIRTMDRSERIRTYNYPENRIADHRTGYKAYNLDQVMNGDLEPVIQSAIEMDEQARLDAIGE